MVVKDLVMVEMEHYLVAFGCLKLCVMLSASILCEH